jgi:hypothetical protein
MGVLLDVQAGEEALFVPERSTSRKTRRLKNA